MESHDAVYLDSSEKCIEDIQSRSAKVEELLKVNCKVGSLSW